MIIITSDIFLYIRRIRSVPMDRLQSLSSSGVQIYSMGIQISIRAAIFTVRLPSAPNHLWNMLSSLRLSSLSNPTLNSTG